jgi:hypothetical protein
MPKIVEPKSPQAGMLQAWQEVVMHEVTRVEDRARLRPEDQIVRNTVLASHHSGEQPRIAQFQENLPELA